MKQNKDKSLRDFKGPLQRIKAGSHVIHQAFMHGQWQEITEQAWHALSGAREWPK